MQNTSLASPDLGALTHCLDSKRLPHFRKVQKINRDLLSRHTIKPLPTRRWEAEQFRPHKWNQKFLGVRPCCCLFENNFGSIRHNKNYAAAIYEWREGLECLGCCSSCYVSAERIHRVVCTFKVISTYSLLVK